MKRYYLGLIMTGLHLFTVNIWAATMIEVRNAQAQTQQIYISEDYARMQMTETNQAPQAYRLIDLKMRKIYMVNLAEKRYFDPSIIRLNPNQRQKPQQAMPNMPIFRGQNEPPDVPITAELIKVAGETIEVAGYPTEHYQVVANGEMCSDDYFSKQALKIGHIAQFDKAMQAIEEEQKVDVTKLSQQHPCVQAYQQLEPQMTALGMRMKSVYAMGQLKGQIRNEVMIIKTDAQVEAGFFSLEDFAPLSLQETQQIMQPRRR
ncbi:MAG: hypothetical protein VSS52_004685 [Thiotrichaceae bacterium]|nr:hypothetical protein [Thiotrichaceae bacterium]